METVRRFLKKLKNRTSVWSSNSTSGCISEGNETRRISQKGLFTIARMWKQSTSRMNGSFQKNKKYVQSVQFSRSVVSDSVTPWSAAHQASLSIINSWSLLKLMCIESVMPFNHLILCHPILFLPPIPPSIRVFSKESDLLQNGLVGSTYSPRDSQESSPTPQFKSINSSQHSAFFTV